MQYRIKNKTVLLLWLGMFLTAAPLAGFSQTFGEIFNQKKTQKRYLLEQIVAFQVYIGYAKKGYDIVGSGLGLVKDLSKGEFSLHSAFISSLSAVSPFVRDNAKVAQIIAYQLEVIKGFNQISSGERLGVGLGSFLSASNLVYVLAVRAEVLAECAADLQELVLVVTPGLVQMDDHERLVRLDRLYLSMRDKAGFTRAFCADVTALSGGRRDLSDGIDFLNRAYEK